MSRLFDNRFRGFIAIAGLVIAVLLALCVALCAFACSGCGSSSVSPPSDDSVDGDSVVQFSGASLSTSFDGDMITAEGMIEGELAGISARDEIGLWVDIPANSIWLVNIATFNIFGVDLSARLSCELVGEQCQLCAIVGEEQEMGCVYFGRGWEGTPEGNQIGSMCSTSGSGAQFQDGELNALFNPKLIVVTGYVIGTVYDLLIRDDLGVNLNFEDNELMIGNIIKFSWRGIELAGRVTCDLVHERCQFCVALNDSLLWCANFGDGFGENPPTNVIGEFPPITAPMCDGPPK